MGSSKRLGSSVVRAPGAVPEGPGFNLQSGHLFCQPLTGLGGATGDAGREGG